MLWADTPGPQTLQLTIPFPDFLVYSISACHDMTSCYKASEQATRGLKRKAAKRQVVVPFLQLALFGPMLPRVCLCLATLVGLEVVAP